MPEYEDVGHEFVGKADVSEPCPFRGAMAWLRLVGEKKQFQRFRFCVRTVPLSKRALRVLYRSLSLPFLGSWLSLLFPGEDLLVFLGASFPSFLWILEDQWQYKVLAYLVALPSLVS